MRPFLVVAMDEGVEAHLLLEDIVRGGARGLGLEGEMHTLVAAVLLGMTGGNALETDAEPQPPDGQFA